MNLSTLFETQKELDKHIILEKNLGETDLLGKKVLALQVELGELANELPEEFKFWSNKKNNYEQALEEYCDCLHFILSIGNDLGYNTITEEWISEKGDYSEEFTTDTFIILMDYSSDLYVYRNDVSTQMDIYEILFLSFISLGLNEEHLGFTWEQIEQAYLEKNEKNHRRQENGY